MRILLDHNVNSRFGRLLPGHEAVHAHSLGWDELLNGEVISAAEAAGFAAILTADKSMRYKQNLTNRAISVIVLNSRRITLPHIAPLAPQVVAILSDLAPASFVVVNPG